MKQKYLQETIEDAIHSGCQFEGKFLLSKTLEYLGVEEKDYHTFLPALKNGEFINFGEFGDFTIDESQIEVILTLADSVAGKEFRELLEMEPFNMNEIKISSLQVAEVFDKEHKYIVGVIEELIANGSTNFEKTPFTFYKEGSYFVTELGVNELILSTGLGFDEFIQVSIDAEETIEILKGMAM